MSDSARWRPAQNGGFIDYRLKEILTRRYGPLPLRLKGKDLDFLDGVGMAGIHTRDVIEAIEKHGEIVIEREGVSE